MKSSIERLENRTLLSAAAYPVIANDAAVLADNQHLTADKAELTADSASFHTLISADKKTLSATVAADRNEVKADKAVVKADTNNPTLLAPAQTVLENAMIKLSGDTASLKTKLSVDSAKQKSTLGMDNLAVHDDQLFLRSDTAAANAALSSGTKRMTADISAIERGAGSMVLVALEDDVNAAARGQVKPDDGAVSTFASALTTALTGAGLSAAQQTALAHDLIDVVNGEGVPAGQTQAVISDAQSLLTSGGATTTGNAQAAIAALEALVLS